MVTIKSKEQYFEPDPTNEIFPLLSLDKHYEMVLQYCQIHGDVPEDVRSYFNAIITLYLYGWLYYPFFTLASERSLLAVEMALRKRLPPKKLDKKGRDPRNLVDVLTEAKGAGLVRDEGFPSLERSQRRWTSARRGISEPRKSPCKCGGRSRNSRSRLRASAARALCGCVDSGVSSGKESFRTSKHAEHHAARPSP